jgi:nitroreductase
MNVTEAVDRRMSVRAFKPDPVPAELLRDILHKAGRAPSGGNVQPWKIYALAGQPLDALKRRVAERTAARDFETPEYEVYPRALWEPYRTYRFECGEDLYRAIGIGREDRAGRLAQIKRNFSFFDAPVGLFFFLERRFTPAQWSDLGMYMQTLMLLAVEAGLDTCAQEIWAQWPKTIAEQVGAPEEQMLWSGMALGYRDPDHPINTLRTRRAAFEDFAKMQGF